MKAVQLTFVLIAVLLAAFSIFLYQAHTRYAPFSDSYHHSGGNSARLSAGRISYRWHGPADGEVVVLVHGFSTPKFVWQNTVPDLVAAGFRVLSFDHFGRGHSERPNVPYDRDHYVRELHELLNHQNLKQPVNLVGYSMGGGNVASFTAQYPERVKRLVLLAPAGFMKAYSGLPKLLTLPFVGEQLLTLAGATALIEELQTAADNGQITAQTSEQFRQQFYTQGSTHALASTLRHYPMYDLSSDYQRVGLQSIPVTAIWGDADEVVPISGAKAMKQQVPQLQLKRLNGAKHDFTFTQADRVNPLILDALRTP